MKRMNGDILPESEWSKTMRVLRVHKSTGQVNVSIKRILNAIGISGAYLRLPLEEYQDIMEDRKILYVTIPKVTNPTEETTPEFATDGLEPDDFVSTDAAQAEVTATA